jgi:hypothetical protein
VSARGLGRWAGLAVVVIAAMALGRAITDLVPVSDGDTAPFVRTGVVGKPVDLRYASVEVTGVRAGPHLYGADPVAAAGQFLLVDTELSATRESTTLLGIYLLDPQGRRYAPVHRGATCPTNTTVPTGLRWYATFCFDVPRRALEGARLVVSKGEHGAEGDGQRRDDLAQVDLGISAARARELWASELAYRTSFPGLEKPSTKPVVEKP